MYTQEREGERSGSRKFLHSGRNSYGNAVSNQFEWSIDTHNSVYRYRYVRISRLCFELYSQIYNRLMHNSTGS